MEAKKLNSNFKLTEFLSTSICNLLPFFLQDFGGALKQAISRNPKLLPEGAYGAMFMNIEQIFELEKRFLGDLEERMQNW